jgi:predicted transposase/invertase (TIGR01784 family)
MCSDEFGNSYIVEMQIADGDDFIKRAEYYAAKAYSSQLNIGEKYHTLKEIICLAITNFVMFPYKKEYKSDHVILDKLTNEHNLKDFSFTFLELAKFNKTKEELSSIIDKWAYFFKHANETSEQDLKFITSNDLIIERAFEELNQFSWSKEEILTYEAVIKRDRDHMAIMDKQNRLVKVAGIAEGIEKGEQNKAKAIAIAMLKEGLDIPLISKFTNISIKDIKELEYL